MSGGGDLHLRNSTDIQGDILAGFNKDHRMYLFLKFPDGNRARGWLKELTPRISTTKDVASFNERFSAARQANGGTDPANLKAIWINVSLTAHGLTNHLFTRDHTNELQPFEAFLQGPAQRAPQNGDAIPLSDPQNWVVGGPHQDTVDAMLIVATDDIHDLMTEMDRQRALLTKYGVTTIFEQRGETLPGSSAGHEHFGFKDGISQPGVVGFDPAASTAPDPNHPSARFGLEAGHLGTELIAAGEFVLGESTENGPESVLDWMKNGAFQVFRRLAQDVPGFWAQITTHVHSLPSDEPMTEEVMGAKLVGRWRSGTPLDLAPTSDAGSGHDPKNDNNFDFLNRDASGNLIKDAEGNFVADEDGLRCPRFAHIRKVYPRQDNFFGNRSRRIIRRGIPFGLPFNPTAGTGFGADAERGLLFISYMASIENQFEFLQQVWVNNPEFPPVAGGQPGPDPIIGDVQPRPSDNTFHLEGGNPNGVSLDFQRFVNTTGAVYAFAPSISTLKQLANGQL